MEFIVFLGKGMLRIIFAFMKLFPVKNKIIFISRQHETSNTDFDLLTAWIAKHAPAYKCVILTKMIHPGLLSKLSYLLHMLRQMYHLATSKAVVLDTYCIAVSILPQRSSLTVIQLWHAVGAFKKFGYSIIGRGEGSSARIAKLMQMHEHYDYVCTSSKYTVPYFAEAFHVSREKMKVFPLPRLDRLKDEAYKEHVRKKIFHAYPKLADGKKIIMYAPTFRKQDERLEEISLHLASCIDRKHYHLVVKPHPLSKLSTEDADGLIFDKSFETIDMGLIADYVITDYSAIIFEIAYLEKPVFLYAYDYDQYTHKRDFYLDYKKDLPQTVFEKAEDVVYAIEHDIYDKKQLQSFVKRYIAAPKISYTTDLGSFIIECCVNKSGKGIK